MTTTLREIPDRVAVGVDANVIPYALFPHACHHAACARLLERGARGYNGHK
jgi:hypothetical protein